MEQVPPKRVVMMVNPTAGGGRGAAHAPQAAEHLRNCGIEVTYLSEGSAEAAVRSARAALADGADALVACGGDGTVNAAVQLVATTDTALGIIPVGTGDDNARSLGLPLQDVSAAAQVIAQGVSRQVDLGRVHTADGQDRWFLGVMSSGFDSSVNERANRMTFPRGKARYLVATIAELSIFSPLPYRVSVDGAQHDGEAMLVAVGNGVSYGGGMKVCPSAVLDDGELSVTFLGKVSKLTFLRVFPKVFAGSHVQHPAVHEFSGRQIAIDAPGQVVYADGERVGDLPARVECHEGALRVLVAARD